MLNGFSKDLRVRVKADYHRVFAERKRLLGRFSVLFYQRSEHSHARMGVVVSKRNVRHAVLRNRFKRQARELFRKRQRDLPAMDIVIVAKSGASKASKQELQQCLEELITRLVKQCASSSSD